jgi:hypothetical protein
LGSIAHSTGLAGQVNEELAQSTSPGVVIKVGGVNEGLGLYNSTQAIVSSCFAESA